MTVEARRNEEGTALIYVNGVELYIGFTPETTDEEVQRFVRLCEPIEYKLLSIKEEYDRCLALNYKAQDEGRKGRDWPIFREWDHLRNRLCMEAGIVDT